MNLKTLVGTGRIGRGTFWATTVVALLANFVMAAATNIGLPFVVWAVIHILTLCVWLLVCVARTRDMGRSGWFGLLVLVPIANIVVVFWLGCSRNIEDTLAAEAEANGAIITVLEHGPRWMSLIEISDALGGDWERAVVCIREMASRGELSTNGLDGRERRYGLSPRHLA